MSMFLNKKYILANELVEKMGINISNISMLRKKYEAADDFFTILKMNACSFVNTENRLLPANIKFGIKSNTFTDMSDKLPGTWVRSEYSISEDELFESGMAIEKVKICKKDFYVFEPKLVKEMKGRIGYVLNKEETDQCYKNGQIKGFIELSKNKFFTWY